MLKFFFLCYPISGWHPNTQHNGIQHYFGTQYSSISIESGRRYAECHYAVVMLIIVFKGQCCKTILQPSFTNVPNKLECLFLAGLSKLIYCLQVRPDPTRVEPISGPSLLGRLLALTINIILSCQCLSVTNTLAY